MVMEVRRPQLQHTNGCLRVSIQFQEAVLNQKNQQVIDEFRANGGIVTVTPPRGPVLILHSKGAKTGRECVTPLMYLQDDNRYVIFASRGGSGRNPDWYYNLVANPAASIEVGTEAFAVTAVVLEGDERDSCFMRQATDFPQFAYYQGKTNRKFPVISLTRVPSTTRSNS